MAINIEKISQKYIETILKAIPEIIILLDEEGNYIDILTADSEDLVDRKEHLIGQNVKDVLPATEATLFLTYGEKALHRDQLMKFEYSLIINGEKKYFDARLSPINPKDKIGRFILASIRNITEQKVAEQKLEEQKIYFEQLFNNSTEAIALLDNNHHVIKVNKRFVELFGYTEQEIKENNLDDYILPEQVRDEGQKYTKKVKEGEKIQGESIRQNKTGHNIHVLLQAFPIKFSNGQLGIYAIYQDITKRKEKEKKIKYLSFHDELTGVYNRRYFLNEFDRLKDSRQYPITIIIGDIDRLKVVNDTLGHTTGDDYIIAIATILNSTTRAEDIVARLGGDEFAIILPNTNEQNAEQLCQRIQNNVDNYNKDRNLSISLSLSLGYAVMEHKDQALDDVYHEADQRMYQNKIAKN